MTTKYALIFQGKVVNVIDWDGVTSWQPPADHSVVLSETAGIGDSWDGQKFTRHPVAVVPDRRAELRAKLDTGQNLTAAELREALRLLL